MGAVDVAAVEVDAGLHQQLDALAALGVAGVPKGAVAVGVELAGVGAARQQGGDQIGAAMAGGVHERGDGVGEQAIRAAEAGISQPSLQVGVIHRRAGS